jgi:hypothetical protein
MKEQARKLVAAWSAIPDDEPLDARAWMERYTLEHAEAYLHKLETTARYRPDLWG